MIRFSSPFVVIFLFRVVILMPSAQLEVAIQACRKAGNFINRESLDLSAIEAREKAPFDFVSRVDTGAQERITSIIRQYFPKDSIVAEESGTIVNPGADGVCTWIRSDGNDQLPARLPALRRKHCLRPQGTRDGRRRL